MGNSAMVGDREQHLRALEYANRVRLARARMKKKVASAELSAAEVVLTCPWFAHSMAVNTLLMSQKRWGRARCKRLLVSLGIPENKQIGTLTERQRLALAATLTSKLPVSEAEALDSARAHPTDRVMTQEGALSAA